MLYQLSYAGTNLSNFSIGLTAETQKFGSSAQEQRRAAIAGKRAVVAPNERYTFEGHCHELQSRNGFA